MRYSVFEQRFQAKLAEHNLTPREVMNMASLGTLEPGVQAAFIGSLYEVLESETPEDKRNLTIAWLTRVLSHKLPCQILYSLASSIGLLADEDAAAKADMFKAEVDQAKETAAQELARVKEEAAKAQEEAVKKAIASVGLCVACKDEKADQMPFKCWHVVLCHGRFTVHMIHQTLHNFGPVADNDRVRWYDHIGPSEGLPNVQQ